LAVVAVEFASQNAVFGANHRVGDKLSKWTELDEEMRHHRALPGAADWEL